MVKKSEVTRNQPGGFGCVKVSSSETGDQSWPGVNLLDFLKGTPFGGKSLQKTYHFRNTLASIRKGSWFIWPPDGNWDPTPQAVHFAATRHLETLKGFSHV